MIPKIIHYCWFGYGEKSPLHIKCIESWKKHCPGYEIIEWNEDNIDFSVFPSYVKEAYDEKKWGFVPDYIRLWLVYTYGGIYLDTDVEIIRNIDDLLLNEGFAGFENDRYVNFGSGFGAEKGNKLIYELMGSYKPMHFRNDNGTLNLTPSPVLNTEVLVRLGLRANGKMQNILGIRFYSPEYFCPIDVGLLDVTKKTYSIHWFDASWIKNGNEEWYQKERKKELSKHFLNVAMRRLLGRKIYCFLRHQKYLLMKNKNRKNGNLR